MNIKSQTLIALLIFAGVALFSACQSPEPEESKSSESTPVNFDIEFSSLLLQSVETLRARGGWFNQAATVAIPGVMLVTNTDTLEYETYEFPAYLDGDTLKIEVSRTMLLNPGPYDFYLLLVYGAQQYAGHAHLSVVLDGENLIDMTISPLFGNPVISVTQVAELADFVFQYNPAELSIFTNPQLGVRIDGGSELIYAVNPSTGLASTHYNLSEGTHQIQLRFYTSGLQIGKSLLAQESVIVNAGVNISMDLAPLFGTIVYMLDEGTGEASIQYDLPIEILEEMGFDESFLSAVFSITGPENPLQEVLLGASDSVDSFTGSLTLSGMVPGNVTMQFSMANSASDPPKWFASCVADQVLQNGPVNTRLCRFILKRSVISGELLATVGVNIYDGIGNPVPGAVVSVDGEMMGITGSGAFGTPGYLKLTLPPGLQRISAATYGYYGELIVDLSPLQILNENITLEAIP